MRFCLLLLFSILFFRFSPAQTPLAPSKNSSSTTKFPEKKKWSPATVAAEICNNGLDDDGNGLTDMKDPFCYYNNSNPDTCIPTKILWATFSYRLYWLDLETGADRMIDFPQGEWYDDLAWSKNGKLYGVSRFSGDIMEINPTTGQTQLVADVTGYYYSNGMTADNNGMLYLAAFTNQSQGYVIRFDPVTRQITVIADLTALGLTSAGDLTFMDGYLYLSCINSRIAKIDIRNGTVQIFVYTGPAPTSAYGLVNLGDGYLYISSTDELYRLDPVTWTTTFHLRYPTYGFVSGLCAYTEYCHSPSCKGTVSISVQSNPPFCADRGVPLKGNGSGITGASGYTWTLPDGTTKTGDSINAIETGKYYLRYHTLPDTCGKIDSVELVINNLPAITLQKDTAICVGSRFLLQPTQATGISNYHWQDGSTSPQYQVDQPGIYWVEGINSCGSTRDSVIVAAELEPTVDIGNDFIICEGTPMLLKNNQPNDPGNLYLWSTQANTPSINITRTGMYWLEVRNNCGSIRDTIVITPKDNGCTCFTHVPTAFTPNNDGKNDLYKVSSNCSLIGEFSIYNRWGERVYYSKNLSYLGWNGQYKGVAQASDVYVYYLTYEFANRPGKFSKKGTFVLIR